MTDDACPLCDPEFPEEDYGEPASEVVLVADDRKFAEHGEDAVKAVRVCTEHAEVIRRVNGIH